MNINPATMPPIDTATGLVNVFVECARATDLKLKFDVPTRTLRFHKSMPRGMPWPFAYGFVCGTRAPDGDPLDAVVLSDTPLAPGSLLRAHALAAIEADQIIDGVTTRNDRIVVSDRPDPPAPATIDAVVLFFVEYNMAQGRRFTELARHGPVRARELLIRAASP